MSIGKKAEDSSLRAEPSKLLGHDHVDLLGQFDHRRIAVDENNPIGKAVVARELSREFDQAVIIDCIDPAGAGLTRVETENSGAASEIQHSVARLDNLRYRPP